MCYYPGSGSELSSNSNSSVNANGQRVKSGWRKPTAQDGTFTPEGAPNFLEVEWEYTPSEGVGIVNVRVNGRSIHGYLKESDLEALREEAGGMVEAAEPQG